MFGREKKEFSVVYAIRIMLNQKYSLLFFTRIILDNNSDECFYNDKEQYNMVIVTNSHGILGK